MINGKINNRILPKNRHHPIFSFFLNPGAIAGKFIVLHFFAIAMLNAVMMQIIEMRPKISFGADAPIPIILPDFSATTVLQGIYFIGITSMNFAEHFGQISPDSCFKQEMIVIVQNDPGIQDKMKGFEKFGYLLKQFLFFKVGCQLIDIEISMNVNEIRVIIDIEMVWGMAFHLTVISFSSNPKSLTA